MIVAIDAGNSRIKWGQHDGNSWIVRGTVPTEEAHGLAEIAARWPAGVRTVACNVAGPAAEKQIQQALAGLQEPMRWVRAEKQAHGVWNGYEQPERLGADRWAALIGARAHRPRGASLVVCAGTAITIDWLDAAGHFRGGLILPGMHLMQSSLARNTAQLPYARGEFRAEPRNTMDAIVSGCLHAQAGAIERMFAKASAEGETFCLLTGGAAHLLIPCLSIPCRRQDTLVLDGLLRYATAP